ncbi:dipeptidase [Streptomyces corynorhini]|uniref:Membrane dipeptidase n=1 Tax=Streptomyces corynorhini TaxID=2282652 RepID=A0A370BG60_9ACTN|nr:dipeptidase [Streptomyces corynorhini]RDG38656.1 membrane dipeptidase [Streptomyces corynorhini]
MADLRDDPYARYAAPPAAVGAAPPSRDAPAEDAGSAETVVTAGTGGSTEVVGTAERVRLLLAEHPVLDGHNTLGRLLGHTPPHDLEFGESALDTDLPRLRAGGVGAQFWSLRVPAHEAGHQRAISATLELIDRVRAMIDGCPEGFRPALAPGDLTDARNRGRVASLLGPVAGHALGDSLSVLRAYHALGVRAVTLAGARWADRDGALSRFGQEVVREMNRLGVVVDLSGTREEAMRGAFTVAKAPVLFSHSAARALTDHPANVSDAGLALLGHHHGVCMVSLAPDQTARAGRPPTLRDVADHLDHVREVAGPRCVGLSGGYGATADTPRVRGLEDASCYPLLLAELLERGWTDADIAGLTWGNAARVVRDTEFAARTAQQRRGPSTATVEELDGDQAARQRQNGWPEGSA